MFNELSPEVEKQVERGIAILKRGGIVAFPTDTVYGLGACADIPQAVERIYQVKERPRNMALPLLLADVSQISKVAEDVPPLAWLLVRCFMPGALTLVLHRADSVSDIITGGGDTIAIRIPAHPIPVALIQGVGAPIVGTSANLSGKPSPLTAEGVCSQLNDKVVFVIDGRCPGGRESTVVDVTGETPKVLREGAISREEIARVCGDVVLGQEAR